MNPMHDIQPQHAGDICAMSGHEAGRWWRSERTLLESEPGMYQHAIAGTGPEFAESWRGGAQDGRNYLFALLM